MLALYATEIEFTRVTPQEFDEIWENPFKKEVFTERVPIEVFKIENIDNPPAAIIKLIEKVKELQFFSMMFSDGKRLQIIIGANASQMERLRALCGISIEHEKLREEGCVHRIVTSWE